LIELFEATTSRFATNMIAYGRRCCLS